VIFKIDFEKAYDSVRWDFVEEVLYRKGFNKKLKEWVMSMVRGGKCASTSTGRPGGTSELTGA
jgi:mannosylglycoprotein endo-beta-mannosidase